MLLVYVLNAYLHYIYNLTSWARHALLWPGLQSCYGTSEAIVAMYSVPA
jgi:hypothetical protein